MKLKERWKAMMRINVLVHDHTRIEYRRFPYKLHVQHIESLQEKIDRVAANGGGIITMDGRLMLTETLQVTGSDMHFQGLHMDGRAMRSGPILRIDP